MESYEDYSWLIESRSKIQRLLMELYMFLKDNRRSLQQREFERSVFGLLVGAAYSLWRAAFLVDAERDWPKILKRAEDFLKSVVRNNIINYKEDKDTSSWSVGYYLNNARYRLSRVLSKYDDITDPRVMAGIREFQSFKEDIQRAGGIDERDPTAVWNGTYDALYAAFKLLRGAEVSKKRKKPWPKTLGTSQRHRRAPEA